VIYRVSEWVALAISFTGLFSYSKRLPILGPALRFCP